MSKSTNSTKWTEFEYMREKVPLAIVEIDEFDEMDEIRIHWREGTPVILTKSTNSTKWTKFEYM